MRTDALFPRLAAHLGLGIVRPLAGGEFGATLVRSKDGTELVLKALPSEAWLPTFERGAAIAIHMRERAYPAPSYHGTGTALGATWSLQTLMPGDCPDRMRETHMRRLIELLSFHAGSAPPDAYGANEPFREIRHSLEPALSCEASRPLGEELAAVLKQLKDVPLLEDGVVHGDFHHRNFLAKGDEVSAVIDWEFACAGDWRQDLVTLAFWSAMAPGPVPGPVGRIAIDQAHAVCPPPVLAYFAALRALTQLGFEARVRPGLLPQTVRSIESAVGHWWR